MYVYIFLFVIWRQNHNFSLSDAIYSLHMTETYIDTMSFVLLSQSTKKFLTWKELTQKTRLMEHTDYRTDEKVDRYIRENSRILLLIQDQDFMAIGVMKRKRNGATQDQLRVVLQQGGKVIIFSIQQCLTNCLVEALRPCTVHMPNMS